MMITLLIAFAVGIVLGKAMLPVLHKLKFGQNIYELAPEAHKKKQGTPTMGGLVIAGAAIAAALVAVGILVIGHVGSVRSGMRARRYLLASLNSRRKPENMPLVLPSCSPTTRAAF